MARILLTLTGASGSGKDTMLDALKYISGAQEHELIDNPAATYFDNVKLSNATPIHELVSHTTRAMRKGEKEGESYYFVSDENFSNIEFVETTCYNSHYYGLSKNEILGFSASDAIGAVIVDQHGVQAINEFCTANNIRHISVFIQSSLEISEKRMRKRGDKPDVISQRLCQQDVNKEYLGDGEFNYTLVVKNAKKRDFVFSVLKILRTLQAAAAEEKTNIVGGEHNG